MIIPAVLCGIVATQAPVAAERAILCACSQADDYRSRELNAQVVLALRARVGARRLEVAGCGAPECDLASWHLTTAVPTADGITYSIQGTALDVSAKVEVGPGLRPAEVARLVALSAIEVIRPALDAKLPPPSRGRQSATEELMAAQPGVVAPPPDQSAAVRPAASPLARVEPAPLGVELHGGVLSQTRVLEPVYYVEPRATWSFGSIAALLGVSWRGFPTTSGDGARVSGVDLAAALGGGYHGHGLAAEVSALARAQGVVAQVNDPLVSKGRQWLFNGGGGLRLGWRFAELWGTDLSLTAGAALWWRRKELRVLGQPVQRFGRGEVMLGVASSLGSGSRAEREQSAAPAKKAER